MSGANYERVFVPLGTFVTFGYKSKEEWALGHWIVSFFTMTETWNNI
jgi:hypothetical protein